MNALNAVDYAVKCLCDKNVKALSKWIELYVSPILALPHYWQRLEKVNIKKSCDLYTKIYRVCATEYKNKVSILMLIGIDVHTNVEI